MVLVGIDGLGDEEDGDNVDGVVEEPADLLAISCADNPLPETSTGEVDLLDVPVLVNVDRLDGLIKIRIFIESWEALEDGGDGF